MQMTKVNTTVPDRVDNFGSNGAAARIAEEPTITPENIGLSCRFVTTSNGVSNFNITFQPSPL
jgi:hypothetical protein